MSKLFFIPILVLGLFINKSKGQGIEINSYEELSLSKAVSFFKPINWFWW